MKGANSESLPGIDALDPRRPPPMPRVTLFTEGTYPTVIGGVTKWCELLLDGLFEYKWQVLALGVEPLAGQDRWTVPITQPRVDSLRSTSSPPEELLDGLVRQLFAEVPDPSRLLDLLVACRAGYAQVSVDSPHLRKTVSDAVSSVVEGQIRSAALDLAVELVDEVLLVAGTPTGATDVSLVSCAGRAAIPAVIDNRLHGIPMLVVEHGVYVHEAYLRTEDPDVDPVVRHLVRTSASCLAAVAYASASTVLGVSSANCVRSVSFGSDPRITTSIPNGVAAPIRPTPILGHNVVGTVGRLDSFKGVDVLIRAAAEIARQVPEATFVHIGPVEPTSSCYEEECRRLLDHLGLADRFTFMGTQSSPRELIPEIDVFVLPSRSEGLPFALLEAMAAARPIVASMVGGVPEALHGVGVLVPADMPDVLAQETVALLQDRSHAASLGRLAHERVRERYGLDRMLDGYRSVLDAALRQVVVV